MRLLALLVLLALLGGGYYYWKANPGLTPPRNFGEVSQQLQDTALTGAVRTALSLRGSLKPYAIAASTENGVVTLRGRVPDAELMAAAERVAAAVPDVRQVVNHLELGGRAAASEGDGRSLGEKLDDEALELQLRMAFSLNKGLKGSKIEIQSRRKAVRLSGQVASPEQRKLALEAAREVAGVKDVADDLAVSGRGPDGDEPRDAAQAAVRANPNLRDAEIVVERRGGRLVLRGHVRSGAERDLAGLVARDAAGQPVENALEVRHGME
jgi:osmotically-inducible protein OsmY